jgi:hypothetical protein
MEQAPRPCRRHGTLFIAIFVTLQAAGTAAWAGPPPAVPLPWQPDHATAVAAAQAAHQHIFVMLAAPDSKPCRRLETEALADPLVREALADMVWLRVENDAVLEAQVGVKEHPTLAFVNPFTGGVLHRVSGEKTVELLAREIVHARRAIGVELTAGLEDVASRMFSFDGERAEQLLEAGDVDGLHDLLAPSAADDSRQANYLVAHVTLPAGLVPDDVRFLAGSDCLVGTDTTRDAADASLVAARLPDLAESCTEYGLPASGLVLVPSERASGAELAVRITAPGCRLMTDTIRFAGPAPGTAVQVRHYDLRLLADAEAARLSGRVLKPDGSPAAAAIVRLDDWYDAVGKGADGEGATTAVPAVVRTDGDGRFTFPRVSPGRWLVRAEFPGGEREQFVDVEPAGHASCDLALTAVTTVGLRWVLQTEELSQALAGRGVRDGEAHLSVASSRITLAKGMRVRTHGAGDLMLAQTPLDDDSLPEETRHALAALPAGTPVWYPIDAAYTFDFQPLSGLHRDPRPFATIEAVRQGSPLPDQEWDIIGPLLPEALTASRDRGTYFQFPRGEPVRRGDVFTLRCATSNCFAKLEVTDVTIVTPEAR